MSLFIFLFVIYINTFL